MYISSKKQKRNNNTVNNGIFTQNSLHISHVNASYGMHIHSLTYLVNLYMQCCILVDSDTKLFDYVTSMPYLNILLYHTQ